MAVQYRMHQRPLKLIQNTLRYRSVTLYCAAFTSSHIRIFSLICISAAESQGYYRRGAAYLAMGKFKDALKDFQQVIVYSTSIVPFNFPFLSYVIW